MKKTGKTIITALPFLTMLVFVLIPTVINICISFFEKGTDMVFVGLGNYTKFEFTKASLLMPALTLATGAVTFIFKVIYVFCGMLGIGSIKNKWIRMVILLAISLNFITLNLPIESIYIIILAFLFPNKTDIRHAWYSTLVFGVIYLLMFMNTFKTSMLVDSVIGGGPEGAYTVFAVKTVVAIVLGLAVSKILLRLKEKSCIATEISKKNILGNVFILLFGIFSVWTIIKSNLISISVMPVILILVCVATLIVSVFTLFISMSLAHSMNRKAVFVITCVMLAISFYERILMPDMSPLLFIAMTMEIQMKYMLFIALTLSMFGNGKLFKERIPAMVATISPVCLCSICKSNMIHVLEMYNILSKSANSSENFDTYVYNVGRIGQSNNIESVESVMFILVCVGIVIATAMLKNEK